MIDWNGKVRSMTDTEYQAVKYSFKQVGETCPLVDAAFDEFLMKHELPVSTTRELEGLRQFVKEKNEQLRELTFALGRRLIQNGVPLNV